MISLMYIFGDRWFYNHTVSHRLIFYVLFLSFFWNESTLFSHLQNLEKSSIKMPAALMSYPNV